MGLVSWNENLPGLLDHTVLRPGRQGRRLAALRRAKEQGFVVIFVPPCYVDDAVAAVAGTAVQVGIPISFLVGHSTAMQKVTRQSKAVAHGARGTGHGHQHQPPEIRRL